MSVFGGVQVLSVLCSIVRIKLVAVLIGPVGIGLFGLYNSAIDMINNLSNLGIRSSSVRDISIEVERGSRQRVAEILAVVRRWTWALGIVAAFVTLVASPLLSRWTFGDSDHIWGFIALSVVVMFNALTNCEQSILQGTRRLRQLAQVGVYSVATGLLVSVPLFYFLRHELYSAVPEDKLDGLIEKYIDTFLNEGYITQSDGILYISGDGYQEFSILSRSIRSSLLRYLVGVTALKQTVPGTSTVDNLIDNCLKLAKRLPEDVTYNSPEFADPIMFRILCNTFIRHAYFTVREDGTIDPNMPKVQKLVRAAEPLLAARDVKILNGQDINAPDPEPVPEHKVRLKVAPNPFRD